MVRKEGAIELWSKLVIHTACAPMNSRTGTAASVRTFWPAGIMRRCGKSGIYSCHSLNGLINYWNPTAWVRWLFRMRFVIPNTRRNHRSGFRKMRGFCAWIFAATCKFSMRWFTTSSISFRKRMARIIGLNGAFIRQLLVRLNCYRPMNRASWRIGRFFLKVKERNLLHANRLHLMRFAISVNVALLYSVATDAITPNAGEN